MTRVRVLVALAYASARAMHATVARGDVEPTATYELDELQSEGLERTEPETITELLPRPLPATFTGVELVELRRRIKNLALFDHVELEPSGRMLRVTGSAKIHDRADRRPLHRQDARRLEAHARRRRARHRRSRDTPRRAGELQRARLQLHGVALPAPLPAPELGTRARGLDDAGSGFRFEGADAGRTWHRNRFGAELELLLSLYATKWRYEFQLNAYQETLTDAKGPSQPRDGTYLGTTSEFVYDRYTWNDLTPTGFRASLELRPGVFVGPAEPRHEVRVKTIAGVALGARSVVMVNATASAVNGGNPNHSALLGSQGGVRGLPDSLYRNRSQAYANVELRHAVEIARRWYVQGVLFADAAVFEPMDARAPRDWR